MLRLLSAAAAGLSALLVLAAAGFAQPCVTQSVLQDRLTQTVAGVSLRELKGDAAQSFVAAFNAVPPQSGVLADTVLVAQHAEAHQSVAMFFLKDCMVGRAVLSLQLLHTILLDIEKEA